MAKSNKKKTSPRNAVSAVEEWLAELLKQTDEWTQEQVGDLLAQVKDAGGHIPDRYYAPEASVRTERMRLGQAISFAFAMELVEDEFKADAHWKRRIKQLGSIETKARSVLKEMADDPVLRLMMAMAPSDRPILDNDSWSESDIVNSLRLVTERAASTRALLEEFGRAGGFGMNMDGPAKQSTLLQSLDSIYEGYLDIDPQSGIVKTYNKPGGPFVAFVRAAHHVAKKSEMNDATLYKALQRAGLIGQTDKA